MRIFSHLVFCPEFIIHEDFILQQFKLRVELIVEKVFAIQYLQLLRQSCWSVVGDLLNKHVGGGLMYNERFPPWVLRSISLEKI